MSEDVAPAASPPTEVGIFDECGHHSPTKVAQLTRHVIDWLERHVGLGQVDKKVPLPARQKVLDALKIHLVKLGRAPDCVDGERSNLGVGKVFHKLPDQMDEQRRPPVNVKKIPVEANSVKRVKRVSEESEVSA